jgi:hypothetical protein
MSLIDKTYFVNDINIPSGSFDDGGTLMITRHEPDILKKLLGYELYKLVIAYDPDTSEQRIIDIVEGKEYLVGERLYKWNGLINTEKESLIAYYVYVQILRDRITHTATSGEIKPKYENSDQASVNMKTQSAWVKLRELYGSAFDFDYDFNSCYSFMLQNWQIYPEWLFTEIGSINAFDL